MAEEEGAGKNRSERAGVAGRVEISGGVVAGCRKVGICHLPEALQELVALLQIYRSRETLRITMKHFSLEFRVLASVLYKHC